MTHRLAMIGFGGVGQGLATILRDKKEQLAESYDFDSKIVAVSDMMKGAIYHPDGLDIDTIFETLEQSGHLEDYPDRSGLIKGLDSIQTIKQSNADTIVEVTYTDVKTGQPAIDHCQTAFKNGKNVVMTNKGPVALRYQALSKLAVDHHVQWGFEGTVMSGTPTLRMPGLNLAGNNINEIRGILNGTTNYIFTQMEQGADYQQALEDAQKLGYAEADPTSDVEGYDALYKVVILANVVMGVPLTKDDVICEGMTHISPEDIARATDEGMKWKMIGKVKKDKDQVIASVQPEKLPLDDPLASMNGALNAITYDCDLLGPVTVVGAGAGISETGFSLLIDLINIHKQKEAATV